MGTEVVGPGGIWGQVQGVGSDHWATRSLPSLALIRAQRGRARSALFSRVNINDLTLKYSDTFIEAPTRPINATITPSSPILVPLKLKEI